MNTHTHNMENNFFTRRGKEKKNNREKNKKKKKKKTLEKLSYHGYVGGFFGIISPNVKHTVWICHFNSFMHVAHAYSVSFYVLIKTPFSCIRCHYTCWNGRYYILLFYCTLYPYNRKIKDFKCCVMTEKECAKEMTVS